MRKIAISGALATILTFAGAAPATAGALIVPDSTTDAQPSQLKGDIGSVEISYGQGTLSLGVLVSGGEAPTTDAWTNDLSDTRIELNIDTNLDGTQDYKAVYASDTVGLFGELYDTGGLVTCAVQPDFAPSPVRYGVRIPASCIGSPQSVKINAEMFYDPTPGTAGDTSDDKAPDTGFSDAVATEAAAAAVGGERPLRVGVVGAGDNQVWAGHGFGSLYDPLGGQLIAAPAVADVPQPGGTSDAGVPVFVGTGTDHQLWVRTPGVSWRTLSDARTYCKDNPAATVRNGQLTVACWGEDNALWTATGPITTTTLPKLNAWRSVGGVLTAGPAVGDAAGLVFLVVGSGGKVYQSRGTGYSPTPWTCKGHPAIGSGEPPADGPSWFACHGTDDGLWVAQFVGGGWGSARPLGGKVVDGPGVAINSTTVAFFVQGTDGAVWQRVVRQSDATPATDFTSNGGKVKFGVTAASI
jgi:hypothetical protein